MGKRTGEWDVIICLTILLYGLVLAELFLHQWLIGHWAADWPPLPDCAAYPAWFPLYFWAALLLTMFGALVGRLFGMA